MPTKQQGQRTTDQEQAERQQRHGAIAKRVLQSLGPPGDLHRVQIRPLWQDYYRVNVLLGPDAISAKVAHSYFLLADRDGNILASTPEITRRY